MAIKTIANLLADVDDDPNQNAANAELRQSFLANGWLPHRPMIVDEHDVIICGHRRLKIATKESIPPVVQRITFGDGEAADAERLKMALADNSGNSNRTAKQRKRYAEYLYQQGKTQQTIADLLGVTKSTIQRDLEDFNLPALGKLNPRKTETNPKGAGRPKKARKNESMTAETAAKLILDKSWNYPQAERETGLSNTVLRSAVAREEGRRHPQPDLPAQSLSLTSQEKLEASIRAHKRKLDIEFETRVIEESKRRLEEITLPYYVKKMEELERSITSRKGIMDRLTYRKILSCLHPDRVHDPALKKRYEEAFRLFTELEKRVLDEKQSPTEFRKMPRTYEELMAMKAKVQAERRAKRSKINTAVR